MDMFELKGLGVLELISGDMNEQPHDHCTVIKRVR